MKISDLSAAGGGERERLDLHTRIPSPGSPLSGAPGVCIRVSLSIFSFPAVTGVSTSCLSNIVVLGQRAARAHVSFQWYSPAQKSEIPLKPFTNFLSRQTRALLLLILNPLAGQQPCPCYSHFGVV